MSFDTIEESNENTDNLKLICVMIVAISLLLGSIAYVTINNKKKK